MPLNEIILLGFFPAMMAYAAVSDLISMTISNRLSLLLVAGFPVFAWFVGLPVAEIGWHLLAGGLMLLIGFALFSRGWIGGGDAKLMAATAVWLGWSNCFEYAVVASSLGGALTLGIIALRRYPLPGAFARVDWVARLHAPQNGVPYGIALAAAGLIVYPQIAVWQRALGV